MASRYARFPQIQPVRKIEPAITDEVVTMSQFDNVDVFAARYYGDVTLGWIIMCANPDYPFEFAIPVGARIRIPLPLTRVYSSLGIKGEM